MDTATKDRMEKLEAELSAADALAAKAREFIQQLHAIYKAADAEMPRPFWVSKRAAEKAREWKGIEERLRKAISHPQSIQWSIDSVKRSADEAEKKQQAEDAKKKQAAEASKLKDEAIAWLLARGKKIGEDFSADDAIATADGIAYNEECTRRTTELGEGGYTDFSGQNCDGPCSGWNGEDRRCDCGNRRVSWTQGWGHSFKSPSVEAEAY